MAAHTSPQAATAPVTAARVAAAKLADLWPPTMLALGAVLTVIWAGSLAWLGVSLLMMMAE